MEINQNFGNKLAVIIDCFEVYIERPSSLIAQAMTWSNYKHHNTVKFLIRITPQGVISFISKAWGARVQWCANAVFTLELFTAVAKFVNLGKIFVSVNDS